MSALPGFGLRVVVGIVEALALGTPSPLLSAVLHLCLAKNLLAWLERKSRPVMLKPYLWRLEAGVVQDRWVTHRELRRAVPPEHFAYRRQLSGQTMALAYRWLLAGWAIQHGVVWSDDRDEANAFCNPDREAAVACDHEAPYTEDQRPGAPDPEAYVPRQPAAPTASSRRSGLAWRMGICAVTCAVACGSVHVGKLKVYHLVLHNRRLHYAPGTLPTPLGPLPL